MEPNETSSKVAEEAAIDRFLASFQNAYNTHNPSAVAELYAPDARWMAAAGPVLEGRQVIMAALQQFMNTVPPVLSLQEKDKVVIGKRAVSVGTYTLTDREKGSASIGGSYLNVLSRDGAGWQIIGQQMNYDHPISAENWVGRTEAVEVLPEQGNLETLLAALQAHYNSGDKRQMTDLFTDDAWVSFGGKTLVTGRDTVAQVLQDSMEGSLQLSIHAVNTMPLGEGMAVDVGWYELTAGTNRVQWGTYSLLARQNEESQWQVHWLVATGSPHP